MGVLGLKSGAEELAELLDLVEALLPDLEEAVDAAASPSSPGFAPGSLILDLENIFSSSYINHRINRVTANTHFVVKVGSG